MTAVGRPAYTPPTAPPVEVPTVAPALQTLPHVPVPFPVVDWEGHWHTLAVAWGCLLAGGAAAWFVVTVWAWAPVPVGVGAAANTALWLLRLYAEKRAFSLALQERTTAQDQEHARQAAERRLWDTQIVAVRDGYAVQQQVALDFARKHYAVGKAKDDKDDESDSPPTLHPSAQEQQAAALLQRLEDLTARVEALQPAPPPAAPERARVATEPTEQVTQQLDPARDLLAAAYHNGPTWKLVERAARHDPIAAAALTTGPVRLMTDPAWRQATKALRRAGVFVQPAANQGLQLAADLDGLDVTDLHQTALDWLVAAGVVPADLPSDLPRQ
jgi:hypothetical protein